MKGVSASIPFSILLNDAKIVRHELFKMTNDSVKIPQQIKKLIKIPELPNVLVAAFTG